MIKVCGRRDDLPKNSAVRPHCSSQTSGLGAKGGMVSKIVKKI